MKESKSHKFTRDLMGVISGELSWRGNYRYDWGNGTVTFTHEYPDNDYNVVRREVTFKLVILNDTSSIVPEEELEKPKVHDEN